MKRIIVLLVVVFSVFVANSFADMMIGFSPGLGVYTVDDPDGDVEDISGLVPLSVSFIYDLNNKTRLYTNLTYIEKELDASTTKIGQDISGYQAVATWQHIFKLSHSMKFYAGGGVTFTQADFEKRHAVDSDGFLVQRYADRSEGFVSAVANISREWEISRSINLGLDVSYQYAITGDGFSGLKAAFNCLYRF